MHEYFINLNKKSKLYQEVHRKGCRFLVLPITKEYVSLGNFTTYYQAIKEAVKEYPDVKQCPSCLDFHKRQNRG
jgi:hypothetical protein